MSTEEKENSAPLLAGLTDQQAQELCAQLRQELVRDVAHTGGHLASNLGVVELTVAIQRVFDTSRDRLVFDVGHQCYIHKILTGRREDMAHLRQCGGIAGFPKPGESAHDAFIAGHASNSVAVALGMARARTQLGENYKVLALIGDGALTGGLAYEGLSNAGQCGQQLLVILNDNGMSIAKNVGGVADHLARQRIKPQYLRFKRRYRKAMQATGVGRALYHVTHRLKEAIKKSLLPCSMFEDMGFHYVGPINGHDLSMLDQALRYARDLKEPVLLHVRTVKGKGYAPAECNPDAYHGVSPFEPETGKALKSSGENFSAVFGQTMEELAERDKRVCAITAAMPGGTGLGRFAADHPNRFFDVGIAEGCAVSMAAGMAKQGVIPVFAVYSTFLQRSYDMLLHDTALDHLHVVLGVDRAGLVGEDGETHHGLFDVAFLSTVPGMTVLAPASFAELKAMLIRAVEELDGPVAVRYPRGSQGEYSADNSRGNSVILRTGKDITLTGYGVAINELLLAAGLLAERGIEAEVIKLNQIAPLDAAPVVESVRRTGAMLSAEECAAMGCVGSQLLAALEAAGVEARTAVVTCGEGFVTHGNSSELKKMLGLDGESLFRRAMEVLGRG